MYVLFKFTGKDQVSVGVVPVSLNNSSAESCDAVYPLAIGNCNENRCDLFVLMVVR